MRKRYFDGEFSTFGEFAKEIRRVSIRNSHDANISKNTSEGGFLVPQYIPCDKQGLSARIFRFIGRFLHSEDIYSKGIEMVDFHKFLEDGTRIVKCKTKIS